MEKVSIIQAMVFEVVYTSGAGISIWGQPFQFAFRHIFWAAHYSPFSSSIREIQKGTFPCHPSGESGNLIFCNIRMIPNSSFGRTFCVVVLTSISSKDLYPPTIHFYRNRNL